MWGKQNELRWAGWSLKPLGNDHWVLFSVFRQHDSKLYYHLRFLAVVLVGVSLGMVGGVKERKPEAA